MPKQPHSDPPLRCHSQISEVRDTSTAMLASDLAISATAGAPRFTDVARRGAIDTLRTCHCSGAVPDGANIFCLDGHVE